ncbi:sensor histidine kinase [Crassaminicella profunda]|uniref:sensor histidine kinase n=1 Tax=Crassaminicella profunda TaxID=1286698 RepID=UPI001CA75F73|nr:ATP-binding protein [Crassaminicella profunda]QZY54928.1 hypothetical protein K7H06_18205 [Crassaminicella profunda]
MKKKILLSFTLSLIIPILIMIGLFFVIQNSTIVKNYLTSDIKLNNQKIDNIDHIMYSIDKLRLKIEDNYSMIKDYETFYQKVFSTNQKYVSNLQIVDPKGKLLFDALDKEALSKNMMVDKKTIQSFKEDSNYKTSEEIYINDQLVGTALITMKVDVDSYFKKYFYITLSILILSFLILIGLILFFSIKISKSISEPIKALNLSAEGISKGVFDIKVDYDEKNEISNFCKIFDNMRIQLKDSSEEKVKYEQSRKELFACISHDLRTPITSIKSYVEALEKGLATSKEKQDRYLSVIKNKTDELDQRIQDLFCLSQLEIGKFPMDFVVADSKIIFKEILASFEMEFKDLPITFRVNHPIPSVQVKCDKKRIAQVLLNIIENAKKYVPDKGLIQVSTIAENNSFIVAIKDNGSGIPSEHIPYVFDHFFTGEKSRTKKHGGTGLGLAICKQIILAHGGEIWVESTVDVGTTFYFSLPF